MHEGLHDVLAITVAGKRGEAMENKRGHRFKLEEYWRQANRCSGASFWGLDVMATPSANYGPFIVAMSPMDSPLTIYTRLPARADSSLLPLLLSKGVVIITRPIASPPGWVLFLEKHIPLLLAFFALLLVVKAPPWKGFFPSDTSLDDKITRIAERRIHRIDRVQERSEADSESNAAAQREKRPDSVVTFAAAAGANAVRAEAAGSWH